MIDDKSFRSCDNLDPHLGANTLFDQLSNMYNNKENPFKSCDNLHSDPHLGANTLFDQIICNIKENNSIHNSKEKEDYIPLSFIEEHILKSSIKLYLATLPILAKSFNPNFKTELNDFGKCELNSLIDKLYKAFKIDMSDMYIE